MSDDSEFVFIAGGYWLASQKNAAAGGFLPVASSPHQAEIDYDQGDKHHCPYGQD
jgi:hypothetical protein